MKLFSEEGKFEISEILKLQFDWSKCIEKKEPFEFWLDLSLERIFKSTGS